MFLSERIFHLHMQLTAEIRATVKDFFKHKGLSITLIIRLNVAIIVFQLKESL